MGQGVEELERVLERLFSSMTSNEEKKEIGALFVSVWQVL